MEITSEPNLIRRSVVFDASIDRVYQMLYDPVIYQDVYSPFISSIECLNNGSMFNIQNAEFKYIWKNYITVYFKVNSVVEESSYKMLDYNYTTVQPTGFSYNVIYKLYRVSTEMKTLMVIDIVYETQEAAEFHATVFEPHEKKRVMDQMLGFLAKQLDFKQEESIILPSPLVTVWGIISNWNEFIKYAPQIGDRVEYCGGGDKGKELIKLTKENVTQVLKVMSKDCDEKEGNYVLALVDENSPPQEIILSTFSIDDRKCLLVFQHIFLKPVPFKNIQNLSECKKNILKALKQGLKSLI
jgi:hypothetical protein